MLTAAAMLIAVAHAGPAHADVSFDQKMLELVNQQRTAAGIAPLQWSDSLGAAAEDAPYNGCGFTVQGRAMDMGLRNYFSHNILGCLTQNVFSLLGGLGIVSSTSGENIAWMNGTTDFSVAAQRLTTDLMNSPGHRANILNPDFTQVGIGSWHTGPGQTWSGGGAALSNVWITAQIFGKLPATTTTTPPAPAVGLSPTGLSFGDRAVGTTSSAQTVTVTNQGTAALKVTGAGLAGTNAAEFGLNSSGCASVAAGASCSLGVTFAPTSAGPKSANLQLNDNAAGSPQAVSLSGTGTAVQVAVPDIPVGIHATAGDGQLGVSWSPAPAGAAVDGYAVNLWDLSGYTGQQKIVCATCLTSSFTGLTNGKQYYVTVYGHDAAGWSYPGYSTWTTVAAKPGAPTNVQASPGNAQLTVSWVAPTTPGAAIDGYGAYIYDSTGYTGKSAWVCTTCTSATVAGLTNGTSYYAVVYAHNPQGWGSPASSSSVVIGTPGAPGNLVTTAGAGQIGVTWTAAANAGSAVQIYEVFAFDAYGGVAWWTIACGTCTSTTATGLVSGRSYTVAVYAHNAIGWGSPATSAPVTVS